nr:immunoglobulin heavy chain junction region [Mus musculus]
CAKVEGYIDGSSPSRAMDYW